MQISEQELARLAAFPAQNPNPVVEIDYVTGEVTYSNPAGKKRFPEMMAEGFNHALFSEVKKRISLKKEFQCEVTVGNTIFEQKIYFIEGTNFIRVYSSDITHMKTIEKNLSRLASFPEQNPSPIIEVDMNMNITYFNPAALIHFPDFYEKKFDHIVLQGLKKNFEKFRSGELQIFSEEVKIGEKYYDQRTRFMADSRVVRMFNLDVTQLKRAEEIIKEKNKDITDSINYAKKIQQSILPSESVLKNNYADSFVLYNPKDIISGDFYLVTEVEEYFLLACADCTGHGVPGALMSMLGSNFISTIVNENEIRAVDGALLELDKRVRKALKQDEETESKDGMDIVFCALQKEKKILHYAGANRPLAIIRKGELLEYDPDKFAIGGPFNPNKKFTDNKIQLEDGDCIYAFTDGICDQFGGSKGKKLMKKNFFNHLLQIHSKPMHEQKEFLLKMIGDWRGDLEQVDDILVMGIRMQ